MDKLIASGGLAKKESKTAILAAVLVSLDKIKKRQNEIFARTANTGMFNQGTVTTFNHFKKDISLYQYSAVLDDRTTNICLSLDGRVTNSLKGMPIPPIHANCRSRIVAISKDQTEQPKLNPPPKSVVDKISPNPFNTKPVKTPRNIKGSPAKKVIDNK